MVAQNNKFEQHKSPKTTDSKRDQPSQGQGGGRRVGGLRGSEVQKERKFGGSEEGMGKKKNWEGKKKKGDLQADPVSRWIIVILEA